MISFVIVNYNTRDLTLQCLQSVRKMCPDGEILVVDNASKDGSPEAIREKYPEVKLTVLDRNRGFAGGNNPGIRDATGDIILLLNSDTVVEDDSLNRAARWLEEHPEVGALSPVLIGSDGMQQRSFHRFPSLGDKLRIARGIEVPEDPAPGEPGWLAGTALMIRRTAFEQVGKFLDDAFFMYWEDCDISARLMAGGWKVVPFNEGYIRHYGGASGGGPDASRRPDLFAWYVYGEHRWFAKHRPWWQRVAIWLLDFVDVFRKLIRGLIHGDRRKTEWAHARKLASVLGMRMIGRTPPRPGK